ncbi:NADP-dependent oxidoreductase [Flavihumibacter profundi]|uniref:NADP-dependent oxidoreductase n=1 Tax=Flavihumibacter profundi TaxID=2716883 RepID=UPI001CC5D2E1|nr:NADP-dependent oxidoreductase [Flavihumibacter profundi]MBZ5857001.1 NADP-dependent oxidoreductase [Flavihumibacter profundi]
MVTKRIVLKSRPIGIAIPENFKIETIELSPLNDGEVLVRGLFFSVDPYMRGRMNEAKSYTPPFQLDQHIEGGVVAKVVKSNSNQFKTGDLVIGMLPWQEQMVVSEKQLQIIDGEIAPPSYYLGILGMPGLTAYVGLMHIGKPKEGETVVVSGAAGAVGMVVGQIAKIQGCRVIGIAGSDEKCALLKKDFGFDVTINYRTVTDIKKAIAEACPNGVDIYFDNVGGEISDAVISNINFHARIPLCGQISLYNVTEIPMGPRLQPMLLTRSVLMQGFIIFNYQHLFPEGRQQLLQWVKNGQLKFTETVLHGFDQLPNALIGLFKGENTGKMIVEA